MKCSIYILCGFTSVNNKLVLPAAFMMQQQRQQQQSMSQQSKSIMQQQHMSQQSFSQQQQQQHMMSVQNGLMESFRVDTFEYRLLHEVEFRQSLTTRLAGEVELEVGAIQGPPQAPQLQQKPRSTKVSDGGNATFTVSVSGHPSPRVCLICVYCNLETLLMFCNKYESYKMQHSINRGTYVDQRRWFVDHRTNSLQYRWPY